MSNLELLQTLFRLKAGTEHAIAGLEKPHRWGDIGEVLPSMKTKPKNRISRITVSRLYNTGNYTNISYSLTVDVPEGASAASAIRAVENILKGLAPLRDLSSAQDLENQARRIDEMEDMDAVAFERQYGCPTGGRKAYTLRCRKDHQALVEDFHKKMAIAKKARDLFDDLGGAEKWKDAKQDWDKDDQW